jgi:hypothetical protein
MDIFRTLIIPTANVELARAIAASFGTGGMGMWTTPLSADGQEPASHYISSGYIPAQFAHLVPLQSWAQDEDGVWVMTSSEPGDPVAVYEAASAQGVECTQDDINAIFAASDVTEQEPFIAMARIGVQIVQDDDQL